MYFESVGNSNTGKTLELALQVSSKKGINNIVVASSTGQTAEQLSSSQCNIICVTCANGFSKSGENIMSHEQRKRLHDAGIKMLTNTHVLSGVERSFSRKSGGVYPAEIMANTLYLFGAGTKVCVEISVMALDAGLIPYGEKIIAIAGTGRGADTALIITPAHAANILDTKIHEIICKPIL